MRNKQLSAGNTCWFGKAGQLPRKGILLLIMGLIVCSVYGMVPTGSGDISAAGRNKADLFAHELQNIGKSALVQETREIKGTVYDNNGQPLPGVTVLEKGTTNGTFTDNNGKYSLKIISNTVSLVFSFVGMKTIEEPVNGRSVLDMVLLAEDIGLDEIVVVGYGEQKKVNLTGSVATVRNEDLVKVPSAANVSQILIGKAPGLLTKQSEGVPGADNTTLSIRGYDSPLVLVDGIEMAWNRLDPNDIESVSVLKDAAAAVYGARAGNGVILVTTKRGTARKPTITYSNGFTYQQPTVIPEFVSSWKYAELLREGEFNSGLSYTYSEDDVQKFMDGTDPSYVNTNWYNEIFVNWAPMQTHNLSASGGNEKIKFFMSLGYLNQASTFRSGDMNFDRYNIRSNVDAQITDRLSASIDISFRNEERILPESSFSDTDALSTIWTDLKLARPVWPAHLPDDNLGGAYCGFTTRSPLAQTYSDKTGFEIQRRQYITGRINLKYKIPVIDGLEANAGLNYTTNNYYNKTLNKPFEVLSYDYNTGEYISWGENGSSSLNELFSKYVQLFPTLSLNYNRTFGDHSFQGLLLAEWISTDYINLTAGRVNLLSSEVPYLFSGSPDNITNNGSETQTGRISYVGRGNYNYKGKYLLEGTFRYDASHKFPAASRWGFFPSVSAGWRISEEPFMKDNLPWVDNLKLRASFSQSGDDNVTAFKYLTGYEIQGASTDVYVFGSDAYRLIESTGMPNENITWLTMTSYNLGMDARFLDGLVGFEFDIFYRKTEGIFGQPLSSYPSTFGATLPQMNINTNDDRGFELVINHRNRIGNDFTYSVSGSFSIAREKYVYYSESPYNDPDEIRIYQNTGHYTNRWIGYRSDGIFMTQEEIDNYPINQDEAGNTTLRPGDIRYIDLNDDGIINWRDQTEIGYGSFPDMSFGMELQADYKGITLSALFQGASMFNINITDQYRDPLTNWGTPYEFQYKYRWQPDLTNPDVNINPDAILPAILGDGTGNSTNNKKTSDFWLQDATYLRLKNLNLSYELPGKWISKAGVQALSVYVAGSNLITFSKLGIYKKSLDPEGSGLKYYPPLKTFSFGVNITL
jgi:TonB-linked SusC/RagA family outer membrane protein